MLYLKTGQLGNLEANKVFLQNEDKCHRTVTIRKYFTEKHRTDFFLSSPGDMCK